MRQPTRILDMLAGTTLRTTWVCSASSPSPIYSSLLTNSDTMVSSFSAVSSGNGFFYGVHTLPNSDVWLVNEWNATIDGYPYKSRQLIHVRKLEVRN